MTSLDSFRCRSCGSEKGSLVLDLGEQPLANNLLGPDDLDKPEPRFPLRLAVCESCWLMQITDIIPPVDLFSDYVYFSSYSDAMLRHAAEACATYSDRLGLGGSNFVVEVASNDGYLLKNFVRDGVPCLGLEPAENIAAVAREAGVDTDCEFFGLQTARRIAEERGHADLIIGNNVFAHAPDTNDFVAGLATLLTSGGTVALEFPYGKEMIDKNEFDTIYHEHVYYFTLTPLVPLLARHGLQIHDVDTLSIHGGSLRLWVCHEGERTTGSAVDELLESEDETGLRSTGYYKQLGRRAERVRSDLLALLADLKSDGKNIAAYGAAAKGSTLLNYCRPPEGSIDFIADRSPHKQGKYSPGLHLPIVASEELSKRGPDYAVLLAWNFADEIMGQQELFRTNGGRFVIPVPAVVIR